MTIASFDKLAYLDSLKSAGIPEDQARAHANALDDALHDAVATKDDLKAGLSEVRLEIEKSKNEVLRWVVPLILAQMALTVGVLLKMTH